MLQHIGNLDQDNSIAVLVNSVANSVKLFVNVIHRTKRSLQLITHPYL